MGGDKRAETAPASFAAVPGELPLEETSRFIVDSIGDARVDDVSIALAELSERVEELKVEASSKFPLKAREFYRELRRARQAFDLLNTGINESFTGDGKSGSGGDPY